MSKTLTLTIGERVAALKIFDSFKGGLATLAALIEDVKQFSVTEAEWEEAKLVKTPQPNGDVQWKWDDESVNKEITVQEPTASFLTAEINKKSDAGEVTLADTALVSLLKKLTA